MTPALALVAVPTVGAALAAVAPARTRFALAQAVAAATLVLAVLAARSVLADGTTTASLGPDGAALVLTGDGLGVALALTASTVAVGVGVFARTHAWPAAAPAYWPLSLALLAGVNGVVLAGDLLTAYLMLELVAVAGAVLVALGGGRARLAASARYLYAELAASLAFLLGAALVWRATGSTALADLGGALDTVEGRAGLAVLTAGLLLKVPVFPLHFWLPAAHGLAAAAVSPWLSALVVKSAAVVLLRVWTADPALLSTTAVPQLLGALGAAAVLWGGVAALRQTELKRLVAYSTVAQLGLILLALPLVAAGSADGWVGGTVQAVAHALPKAALLMAVALLATTGGASTVAALAGTATRRPVAVLALGAAAVSLIGLPPSGGFVAKWYLLVGSLDTGQWWWAATVVLGGLLTAAYLGRLVQACLRAPTGLASAVPATRGAADAVALVLALLGLAVGLLPAPLVELLGGGGHG